MPQTISKIEVVSAGDGIFEQDLPGHGAIPHAGVWQQGSVDTSWIRENSRDTGTARLVQNTWCNNNLGIRWDSCSIIKSINSSKNSSHSSNIIYCLK